MRFISRQVKRRKVKNLNQTIMRRRKNQHVVPYLGKWAVRGFGNKRYTVTQRSKRDAVKLARRIAQNQRSELFIHKRNGLIQVRNTYGEDPNPPKDL